MKYFFKSIAGMTFIGFLLLFGCTKPGHPDLTIDRLTKKKLDPNLVAEGKNIFRFDTFGDEEFWAGLLHLDKAISGAPVGFGDGITPIEALAVGLKVDAEALPADVVAKINSGEIRLDDPKTTIALIGLNAVVGIKGTVSAEGELQTVGITCAVCHSTVDNSFDPRGIGKRLDGWPNRDLNVGAIISLTDNGAALEDLLGGVDEATIRDVLGRWGPGKFSAILFMDGQAFTPDNKVAANLIPAAFGLRDVSLTTYTGWGDISYWNAFVANLEMHGKGIFVDPRLNDPKYPLAVEHQYFSVFNDPDLITPKLLALRAYQHSIEAPSPDRNSFDQAAAGRGKGLFMNKANCFSCHSDKNLKDPSSILVTAEQIGIDDFEAQRSPTGKYRIPPLGGLFARAKGGFYHDGRFPMLIDVVNHYNGHFNLNLSDQEKNDLVEYLKSL